MLNFVSKYATAAHLALMAVAPLFLFPFCSAASVGTVLLWLALLAAVWVLMSPSTRPDELPHEARARIPRALARDPLFWFAVLFALLAAVRALNGGVVQEYDAERAAWTLRTPVLDFLPGCAPGAGYLPFCAAVAASVLLAGVRHALSNSARAAFRSWASVLAGFAAVAALVELSLGNAVVARMAACDPADPSYVGTAFGVMTLVSALSLYETLARGWSTALPFVALSTGANGLATVAFAPPLTIVVVAAALVVLLAFALVCAAVRGPARLRWQLPVALGFVFALSFFVDGSVLGGTAAEKRLPERIVAGKTFFTERQLAARAALSEAAKRVWRLRPWTGRGVGSFRQALWFSADARTGQLVPPGQTLPQDGWLGMLAERGVLGFAPFAVVLFFLCWTYARTFAPDRDMPPPLAPVRALFPTAFAVLAAVTAQDCSILRADVLLTALTALAVPVRVRETVETEEGNG